MFVRLSWTTLGEVPGLPVSGRVCPSEVDLVDQKWVLLCDLQTILLSPKFHCTEEILTIVSLLSVDSVLYNPPARRDEVQSVRRKFISSEGDHLTLLSIYRAFRNVNGNKVGCSEDAWAGWAHGGEEFFYHTAEWHLHPSWLMQCASFTSG